MSLRPRRCTNALIDIGAGATAHPRRRPGVILDHVLSPLHASALARTYTERDAALEEAQYLRELLRSTQEYHAHLLESTFAEADAASPSAPAAVPPLASTPASDDDGEADVLPIRW